MVFELEMGNDIHKYNCSFEEIDEKILVRHYLSEDYPKLDEDITIKRYTNSTVVVKLIVQSKWA